MNYCKNCGTKLGIDCGEAEQDFNKDFCSERCYLEGAKSVKIIKTKRVTFYGQTENIGRQHIFKSVGAYKSYSDEKYNGNISLCGKYWISEDAETPMEFEKMEGELKSKTNSCKNCQRVLQNL